jgi:hypothetical protein
MDTTEEQLVKNTCLIVEANSYERLTLWERWAVKAEWVEHRQDWMLEIGKYNKRAVCVCCFWATIRGVVVLFLDATSELVDWKMIDAWLKEKFPGVRKVDAMNFGPSHLTSGY